MAQVQDKIKWWKQSLELQGIVLIYSFVTVLSKIASGFPFFTWTFFLIVSAMVIVLGIYALLWLRILRKVDLTVAYMNRSVVVIWALIWAALLFGESITWTNIVGALFIVSGIVVVSFYG